MNNNAENHKEYKVIPYTVTRMVLEQDEVATLTTYDRYKNTREFTEIQTL